MISIIVPVYNAGKTLSYCVDSILAQSYTDFELLLIDDGSIDGSGNICDDYAARDKRVRVFHKPNGGVSSARNLGLQVALGYWVTFIDSDDYISGKYLESLQSGNADLVIGQSLHFNTNNKFWGDEKLLAQNLLTPDDIEAFYSKYLVAHILRTPWGKLFKRKLIADIKFDLDMRIGEDTVFVYQYLSNCKSISVVENGCYYYFDDDRKSVKYNMCPEEGIFHLHRIVEQYKKLHVKCVLFEKFIFDFIYSLCEENMGGKSNVWFCDGIVIELIKSFRQLITRKRYVKYWLMRQPRFYEWLMKR